jgi:acetyltransferase-like isoleucine patch superfamily enzyme
MKRYLVILLFSLIRNGYTRAKILLHLNYFHSQGENCFFSSSHFGTEPQHISVGNNVWVATRVNFITHDVSVHMVKSFLNNQNLNFDYVGYIKIGSNIFIGANSTIMPNVKIVDNVILGANSIVTKDILESGVYVGQPLRKIKTFEQYCEDCVNFHTNYPWDNLLKKRKDNKALLKIKRMNYIKTKLD